MLIPSFINWCKNLDKINFWGAIIQVKLDPLSKTFLSSLRNMWQLLLFSFFKVDKYFQFFFFQIKMNSYFQRFNFKIVVSQVANIRRCKKNMKTRRKRAPLAIFVVTVKPPRYCISYVRKFQLCLQGHSLFFRKKIGPKITITPSISVFLKCNIFY